MTGLQTSSKPVAADTNTVDPVAGKVSAEVTPDAPPASASPRRWARPLAETVGWIGLFAALFVGWAWYQTGTLSLIAPYLKGERLLFDPLHVVIDNAPAETVVERTVHVLNRTSSPVTLLGSQPSCGCITLNRFPVEIPAGQGYELQLKVGIPSASGRFEHTIKMFTTHQGSRSYVITVSGASG